MQNKSTKSTSQKTAAKPSPAKKSTRSKKPSSSAPSLDNRTNLDNRGNFDGRTMNGRKASRTMGNPTGKPIGHNAGDWTGAADAALDDSNDQE